MRFVVRECEGFRNLTHGGSQSQGGLSTIVLDRPHNYRRMDEFSTEDCHGRSHASRRTWVREQARVLADRLNQQVSGPRSSSGRTPDSESGSGGSNPSLGVSA